MVSRRSIWIGVACCLTLGAAIAPFPLPGCVGGLFKLVVYMNAGTLFAIHMLLLLAYTGLYHLKVMDVESLRTPLRLSTLAMAMIAIPVLLSMATCSNDWLVEVATPPRGMMQYLDNLAHSKGWTVAQWTSLAKPCPNLEAFFHVTSTFRSNLPVRGPSSTESPFLNSITRSVMVGFGTFNQTELNTYYFPVPNTTNQERPRKKPGLLLFVHGGGWWTGGAKVLPSGCHAAFAHAHGWAYAAVEYRLGRTGWSGDAQLLDVKEGIRHVLKNHGGTDFDPSKVIVIGSSAGANLALAASYQLNNERANLKDPMIAGVVAIAPSTSVEIGTSQDSVPSWRGAWSEAGATRRFCENVPDCHDKLSPVAQVTQYTPPTIVLHGQQDEYYTPLHSRVLMERLAAHKVPHVHLEPPLMPHCLDLAENSIPYQMVRSAMLDLMNSLQPR